jgi:hypothetical protein
VFKDFEHRRIAIVFVLTTQVSSPTKIGSTRSPVGNNAIRIVAVRCSSFCCLTHGRSLVISVKRYTVSSWYWRGWLKDLARDWYVISDEYSSSLGRVRLLRTLTVVCRADSTTCNNEIVFLHQALAGFDANRSGNLFDEGFMGRVTEKLGRTFHLRHRQRPRFAFCWMINQSRQCSVECGGSKGGRTDQSRARNNTGQRRVNCDREFCH